MLQRVGWWLIPVACLVFVGIAERSSAPLPDQDAGALADVAPGEPVGAAVVRDASGRRSGVVAVGVPTTNALVLELPPGWAGRRIDITIWRRLPDGREATPWLQFAPKVRACGTVPIAGLAAGSYDVAAVHTVGASAVTATADAVVMPGRAVLAAAAAPVR
jgi:hypothetical protein